MSNETGLSNARDCIVITRFAREQPGFLDFSYRIRSLAKHYRLTVVSHFPLTQAELQFPDVQYLVLAGGDGRKEWLRYIWLCGKLLRARRPHCAVLLHSSMAPVALLAGDVSTALYWNEHPTHFAESPVTLAPLKRAIRFASRWLAFQGARKASLVMPIGEAHSEDLIRHGCPPQRVRLMYMGVDAAFDAAASSAPRAGGNSPLKLIYIGTISKARGRDIMLEAVSLANWEKTIVQLVLIGADAAELTYCNDYARRLGIADVVQVHGRVAGSAIPFHLRHADIGLCLWEDQPWWRFNPPTKLFEYLVAGLPVLASDIRTHTQYVSEGCNGMIFSYDSQSLAVAIRTLWQRRAELHQLKRKAHESGKQYIWDCIEPTFLNAVREISRP